MTNIRFRALSATVVAGVLAACSGGGVKSITPAAPIASATPPAAVHPSGKTGARLTIVVPRAGTASSARKRPAYVSPSSTVLGVSVNAAAATTYGLTANSPGCAVQSGNLSCTFEIVAPPGNDTLVLTLSDGNGNVLSRNSTVATIASGVATPVAVTLAGVPSSVVVVPGASAFSDTPVAPFHIPGLFPVPVEVEALDADGNLIIGPGAPTIGAVTVSGGTSVASVRSAQTADAGAYILTPVDGTAGGKTATISATVTGVPLADGTTSLPVTGTDAYLFTPALVVGSGPVVNVYSVESGSLFAQFLACGAACGGNSATDVASDTKGNLYVAYVQFTGSISSSVAAFAHGSATSAYTLNVTNLVHSVGGIAVDSHDDLFVASGNTGSFGHGVHTPPSITNYAFGSQTPIYTVSSSFAAPGGIAVDKNGNVYESDPDDTVTIAKYPAATQSPSATLSDPSIAEPTKMVTDASNGLYVVDQTNGDIAYFAAGQTALTSTLTDASFGPGIDHVMIDPSGDLWVSSINGGYSERLDAASLPGTAVITQTIPQGGGLAWLP